MRCIIGMLFASMMFFFCSLSANAEQPVSVEVELTLNEISNIHLGNEMFDVDATIVLRWNPEGSEGKSTKSKIVKRYFGNELIKKLSEITYPQIFIQN